MTLLDPDSETARRFQHASIAKGIFVGYVQNLNLFDGSHDYQRIARNAFIAADMFLDVKAKRTPKDV